LKPELATAGAAGSLTVGKDGKAAESAFDGELCKFKERF